MEEEIVQEPNMVDQIHALKMVVITLSNRFDALENSDRYVFQKLIQMLDGRNIQTGLTTGTKIGTSSTQKVGFFGATPVIQQNAVTPASGGATIDGPARTAINTVITILQTLGLTA